VSCRFDAVDVKIMKSLSEDCRKTTTQVAEEAGVSRPTAIARLKKLADTRLIDFGAKINVTKMGFKLAILTLEGNTSGKKEDIVERLASCPRVLQVIQTVGKREYTALVCAEDADTMLSAIDCLKSVLNANICSWQRVNPILGESFNLKIFLEKYEFTPCGKKCGVCGSFKEAVCVGCPAVKEYRGPL
jgi:Lrp/AsnC family transcriptional regulator for asnA, asnC and gidA